MSGDAKNVKLKRIIVQIIIIAVSAICGIITWFNPMGIGMESKTQFLSILSGIFTGALLSLIYISIEKKFDDSLADEAEKRSKKQFDQVVSEINQLKLSVGNVELNSKCPYCGHYIRSLPDRTTADIVNQIENAQNRIWFLTTNLNFFTSYTSKIEEAVKRNVDVRILVLKPTSEFVRLRYKELAFRTAQDFFEQMNVSIKQFVGLRDSLKRTDSEHKIDIRTHLHFPSCLLYIFDQNLYMNPILPVGKARNTSHILYDLKYATAKTMAEDFEKTFDACWSDSEIAEDNYVFDLSRLEVWNG